MMIVSDNNSRIAEIETELKNILGICRTFAFQFKDPEGENHYGFLATIGSEVGKINAILKDMKV